MLKSTFFVLLLLFVGIQFIRPKKNRSLAQSPNDIALHYAVPDSVSKILKRSCYDCHSNNTSYPWYNRIQPVAWWLQYHVNHGKHSLNFSEFASYTPDRQVKKLKAIGKEIREDGMPLDSYLWIHKDAVLGADEKTLVVHWAESLAATIKK